MLRSLLAIASLVSLAAPLVHALQLDTPEDRQAAVEANVLPRAWAEGHAFDIAERMGILGVPGVSVAVIDDGKIDWTAGYGVRDVLSNAPVTSDTLFQAASISKSVSALVALRLAQDGRLDLDAPIGDILTSHALPDADFVGDVTARRILNHTAGLNVDGFAGYRTSEPIPSVVDVLSGRGNSELLRRIDDVDRRMRYSGGGSTLLQLALMDLTGQDFTTLAHETVLGPLGMTHSTFAQPLPVDEWPDHASAHTSDGRMIPGGFHVYPEQYPAGLWTTAGDIARFALEIQRVAAGEDGKVLKADWGKEMLTPVFDGAALGLFIDESGGTPWFSHSGSNAGFKCDFRASFEGGDGVVVMTNSDMGFELVRDVMRAVASVYEWPGVLGSPLAEAELSRAELKRYAGHYAFGPDDLVFVTETDDRLSLQQLPYPRVPLAPLGDHRFRLLGTNFDVSFHQAGTDEATSLTMSMAPDRAERVPSDVSWPVQDLLHGDAQEGANAYRAVHERDARDPLVDCDRLIELSLGVLAHGPPEAALALAQTTTELYPADAEAWSALGQARAALNFHADAVKAHRTCLARLASDESLDRTSRTRLKADTEARLRALEAR